ncbi:hypothetical protein AR687_08220 [Flavobacteriaceae bacterium CRH]|nr:hypothetical protein AR687_08220 [Flavobacteriaceae bacterium CRH]
MTLKFIVFVILTGLLISCKDTLKSKTKSVNLDTIEPKTTNIESEIADTSKAFTALYLVKSKETPVTDKLRECIKEKIESAETIDFTGDEIPDYICKTAVDTLGIGNEYWISSDFKTIKKEKYYTDGFYYRWFVNLDNDPEPEIFEAVGDSEFSSFSFNDQNLLTGKDTTLLYINPVIIENKQRYWGYAWDIHDIKVRKKGGKDIELFCSLNHKIIRDGNDEDHHEFQKQIPIFFFTGHHTQESGNVDSKNDQWLTLQEIMKQTKR